MSYIVEIGILLGILVIGGILRLITTRKIKNMEGSLGVVKKKNAKGKIIAKN